MKLRVQREQARSALKESREGLAEVRSRRPEVRTVVSDLRRLRRENHFGPTFRQALEGK